MHSEGNDKQGEKTTIEQEKTVANATIDKGLLSKIYEQLMQLINGQLQEIPGVMTTETLISLEQSIKRDIPVHFEELD